MLETARSSQCTIGLLGARTLSGRFVRYGFASLTGTLIDLAAFSLLVSGGIAAGIAAACGYALGTLWHWQVSSRFVFADRLANKGRGRMRQQALFLASAIMGLVVTVCVVTLAVQIGASAGAAKFAAMCVAFTSVWLTRLLLVFAEHSSDA
ncbi:MAG: GtrA family protein [Pseudomonadota bacterium]|nr:GtrA family protein [Pseudomonadota bacterium]